MSIRGAAGHPALPYNFSAKMACGRLAMVSFSPGIRVRRRWLHGRDRIGGWKRLFQPHLKRTLEDVQRMVSRPLRRAVDLFWLRSVRHRASQTAKRATVILVRRDKDQGIKDS